jgi:hypothetical protein
MNGQPSSIPFSLEVEHSYDENDEESSDEVNLESEP